MIQDLISPTLLRNVRSEIQENLSFTPKETDIYKIHQSGDLANLDGLDDSSLKLLPSLLLLRDALYSSDFRDYLSTITESGPLSGRKTDMAINVYTPGCHLLCHDDVIGSRRVSYILYLTDPDHPWKEEWGGALRLYPTQTYTGKEGQEIKVPSPDYTVFIPPAFNQLSFFAVQPGESFHDVEEVYAKPSEEKEEDDKDRVRMAISGWYHIPQEGEEGYVNGLEEKLAEKSSLMQLQGKEDNFDFPKPKKHLYDVPPVDSDKLNGNKESSINAIEDDGMLSEKDLDFLLRYMTPTYLTPDTLESLSDIFAEESNLRLETFLSRKFSDSLRDYIVTEESQPLPTSTSDIEETTSWKVARPPHKHRFLYLQARDPYSAESRPQSLVQELLENLLPSLAFRKWLQLATGLVLSSNNLLARRFRRGKDYTLATGSDDDTSRLEITIGLTPTNGWVDDQVTEGEEGVKDAGTGDGEAGVGGYEVYMAGDDETQDGVGDDETGSNHGVEVPLDMSTGARTSGPSKPQNRKSTKADPAVYQAAGEGEEDDGVLFSMPAGWNGLSIVLRDKGVLRFVKYVSREAKGDRWDLCGEFGVVEEVEEDEEEDEDAAGKVELRTGVSSGEEDNFDDHESIDSTTDDD